MTKETTTPSQPIKVLLIDDEPAFTRLLTRNLQGREALSIEQVNDSEAALKLARSFMPDIILLDILMPKLDGGDLAQNIRMVPELAGIPIIFVSAMVSPKEAGKGLYESGGEQFMAKPVNIDALLAAIHDLTGK